MCDNFYRELREPKFPNRYAHYLDAISESDARKGLELHGLIKMVRSAILLMMTLSLSKFPSHVNGSIHDDSFIIQLAQWLCS